MRINRILQWALPLSVCLLAPAVGYCSVESSLMAVQSKLIDVILPLSAILGIVWASFSFFTGNPNARNHLMLAVAGAIVGFAAPSIVEFVRGLIH